jgi:DNA-binding response OmpR family regulator
MQLLASVLRQVVSGPDDRPPRILHVEDDPDLAVLVGRLLVGHAPVVDASSVAEVKAQTDEHRFDLVLLDLSLPDESGLELLPSLRASPGAPAVLVCATDETEGDIGSWLEAALAKSRATNEELAERVLELVGEHS